MKYYENLKRAIDRADFWLLCRRFATAPVGERRDKAKADVLDYIEAQAKTVK